MRLKILAQPSRSLDGLPLNSFVVGEIYDIRRPMASVFLTEGWAELVPGVEGERVRPPPSDSAPIGPLVLVVEDNADLRAATEGFLSAHGYRVMLAAHGREALQRLREECPDLIVLDLHMPEMDGWQFRTEQRYLPDHRAAVPVLLMTGEENAATQADTLGAVGVIEKPFDFDDLLDAISAAIGPLQSAPDGIRSMRPRRRKARQGLE